MNVLTLGARVIGPDAVLECAVAFEHDDMNVSRSASRVIGRAALECSLAFLAADVQRRLDAARAASTRSSRSRPRRPLTDAARSSRHAMRAPRQVAHGRSTPPRVRLARDGFTDAPAPGTAVRARARRARARAGGALGEAPVRPRLDACGRPIRRVGEAHRRPARLARRAGALRRPDRRPRGLRRRRSSTRASRPRSWPGMGGSSLAPDVLAPDVRVAARATSTCASSTRPTRPPSPPTSTTSTRSRRSSSSPRKSGTTTEPLAFLADAWERVDEALDAVAASRLRAARRVHRGDHRPGQERRGDPPPRRAPRGVPQPARHRRPLLGADLRRARAGVAHRARPRRAAGVARTTMLGACREPDPAANPGVLARARDRRRWPGPAATS